MSVTCRRQQQAEVGAARADASNAGCRKAGCVQRRQPERSLSAPLVDAGAVLTVYLSQLCTFSEFRSDQNRLEISITRRIVSVQWRRRAAGSTASERGVSRSDSGSVPALACARDPAERALLRVDSQRQCPAGHLQQHGALVEPVSGSQVTVLRCLWDLQCPFWEANVLKSECITEYNFSVFFSKNTWDWFSV